MMTLRSMPFRMYYIHGPNTNVMHFTRYLFVNDSSVIRTILIFIMITIIVYPLYPLYIARHQETLLLIIIDCIVLVIFHSYSVAQNVSDSFVACLFYKLKYVKKKEEKDISAIFSFRREIFFENDMKISRIHP